MKKIYILVPILLLGSFYFSLLTWKEFYGGDFYFWPFSVSDHFISSIPMLWSVHSNNGMGGNNISSIWYTLYSQNLVVILRQLGLNAILVQKLVFFIPFFLFPLLGLKYIFTGYLTDQKNYWPVSYLVYLANSYILMIFFGGQLGIALSYSLMPLLVYFVVLLSSGLVNKPLRWILFHSLQLGALFSLIVLFDIRIAYVACIAAVIFFLFFYKLSGKSIYNFFISGIVVTACVLLLHAFWLYPMLVYKISPTSEISSNYFSANSLSFFSFADFSHSFSLLHPNWPENIFGKTNFFNSAFLYLPIIGFATFLIKRNIYLRSTRSIKIVSASSLLIFIGAFLSKGTNEPFGQMYKYLYLYFPGFNLFRDPTKFYILTSFGYALLLPVSVYCLDLLIRIKRVHLLFLSKISSVLIIISFCFIWLLLHHDYFSFIYNFRPFDLPKEYSLLGTLMASDKSFGRSLWIPSQSRFAYRSSSHPAVDLHGDNNDIQTQLSLSEESDFYNYLIRTRIRYIIVPTDPLFEIFLKGRAYDFSKRGEIISVLDRLQFVDKIVNLLPLHVYRLKENTSHAFIEESNAPIETELMSVSRYKMDLRGMGNVSIIFSETYDKNWEVEKNDGSILVTKSEDGLIRMQALSGQVSDVVLRYKPQTAMNTGFIVSLSSFSIISIVLLVGLLKNSGIKYGR